ncbi:hypothetical protein P186_0358 [Pyrobaculum ferrireducens]|uniref:Uncharacterized protein n=1 Tax=Pyrobaculum ferrireducens TaxID=1104324 RepID=G7VGA2_9CREN|nr:hypothetical protein P186_0358 [Pyrobaculum ferrireducens]
MGMLVGQVGGRLQAVYMLTWGCLGECGKRPIEGELEK